jgi:hypothetical protein
LIAWPKVSRPKELGALGILDLQRFRWALRVRWLWLGKIEPDRPWSALQFHFIAAPAPYLPLLSFQ